MVRNYKQANEALTGRCAQRRKIANNTYLERRDNGNIAVKLHATDVVTYTPAETIILNTGGWRTRTTADRINESIPREFRVFSDRGIWLLARGGWSPDAERYAFAEGMQINFDGTVTGAAEMPDKRVQAKLKRDIGKYVEAYMLALDAGEVPSPSAGDCWGCLMVATDGTRPMGGSDHLRSHLEEQYYVPSLLARAIERFPVSQAARAYISDKWAGTDNGKWYAEIGREQCKRSLRRFVNAELGMQA